MAHIVDTRNSGGEFVVLGDAFTLPTSNSNIITPSQGSMRFNPTTQMVEVYNPSVSSWTTVASIITLSGDVTGTGISNIVVTLANTAVTAGTYGSATFIPSFTVNSKGLITAASTFALDITGTLGYTPLNQANASVTITGDATGSASFNGSNAVSVGISLVTSGVSAGSYGSASFIPSITVNSKGLVTSITNTAVLVTSVGGSIGNVNSGTFSGIMAFTGVSTAITQPNSNNSNSIATTQFVQNAVGNVVSYVSGSYLPLIGGTLTGGLIVNGGVDSTAIGATTPSTGAFTSLSANYGIGFQYGVNANGTIYTDTNWGCLIRGHSGAIADVALQSSTGNVGVEVSASGLVNIPHGAAITGTLTATTPPTGDNTTNVATTAFVHTTVGGYLPVITNTVANLMNTTSYPVGTVAYATDGRKPNEFDYEFDARYPLAGVNGSGIPVFYGYIAYANVVSNTPTWLSSVDAYIAQS